MTQTHGGAGSTEIGPSEETLLLHNQLKKRLAGNLRSSDGTLTEEKLKWLLASLSSGERELLWYYCDITRAQPRSEEQVASVFAFSIATLRTKKERALARLLQPSNADLE